MTTDQGTDLYDVIEISLDKPDEVRAIAVRQTSDNAEAIVKMAVIRRGVESSYFTTRPSESAR